MKGLKHFLEKHEAAALAPYAMQSSNSKGRRVKEPESQFRTPFQRDRDRVLYSTAFRRLQYKTQVFVNHEGDHFRTRLTHTLETSQISQTIARALGLNEDLTTAIALAHDVGHGPFGHAGEWALQEKMKTHGGFEHNIQCIRIVEILESSYPGFKGLNLSRETLEGLKKHPERFYKDRGSRFRTLEADIVDLADEIAYSSHDLDDGLNSGLINEAGIGDLPIWKNSAASVGSDLHKASPIQRSKMIIRTIIGLFVTDVIETTLLNLKKIKITSVDDLQHTVKKIVSFSAPVSKMHVELKRFLMANLYQHHLVLQMTYKGQLFIAALFDTYLDRPKLLPPEVRERAESEGLHRSICDYLAGMTDRFAVEEYKRLFEPDEKVF